MVAVGTAAKESIATWIESHGGTADSRHLETATLGSIPSTVRVVGVVHPGSAAGGSTASIKADFQRAINQVNAWINAGSTWLPVDAGMARDLTEPYVYSSKPIPYRDFPFGTCPRLGRGGTSSNRSDNQRGIRLFSAHGAYNAAGAHLSDPANAAGSNAGYADDTGDMPYEPPRTKPRAFDAGPPAALAKLLLGAETGFAWPDFQALGVTSDASFGVGAIYRGRFSNVSLVVLADQASDDDLFTARALTGEAGQRFQSFLRAAGLTKRYLIVRALPVDTLDLTTAQRNALLDHAAVQALHRELLQRVKAANSGITALVALGPGAQRLAPHVAPAGMTVLNVAMPAATGAATSWQTALAALSARTYTKDIASPTFDADTSRGQIPREDLPYGTLRWLGTSGDRAVRPTNTSLPQALAGLPEAVRAELGRRPAAGAADGRRTGGREPALGAGRRLRIGPRPAEPAVVDDVAHGPAAARAARAARVGVGLGVADRDGADRVVLRRHLESGPERVDALRRKAEEQRAEPHVDRAEQDHQRGHAGVDVPVRRRPVRLGAIPQPLSGCA